MVLTSSSDPLNNQENAQAENPDAVVAVEGVVPPVSGDPEENDIQIRVQQGAIPRVRPQQQPLDNRSQFPTNMPASTNTAQHGPYSQCEHTRQHNEGRQPTSRQFRDNWRSQTLANFELSDFSIQAGPRMQARESSQALSTRPERQGEQDGRSLHPRQTGQGEGPTTSAQPQELPNQRTNREASLDDNYYHPSFLVGSGTTCTDCRTVRAFSKCFECNVYLCNRCTETHQRVTPHTIYNFNTMINRLSPELSRERPSNGQPLNQNEEICRLQPRQPKGSNPPSSRVVGAGRRSPGNSSDTSNSNSSNTNDSPERRIENAVALVNRTSPEVTSHQASNILDIGALRRILNQKSQVPPAITFPLSLAGPSVTSPTSSNRVQSPPEPVLPPCFRHDMMPYSFFCMNCLMPICNACLQQAHGDHSIVTMSEGLSRARQMAKDLRSDIHEMIFKLRQALDELQRSIEQIELEAGQVAFGIRNTSHQYIAAIEAREMYLLKMTNQARGAKIQIISHQMENIRAHYAKLDRASDLINDPNKFATDFDALVALHNAFRDLKEARNVGPGAEPCEDSGFGFTPPDDGFFQSVARMGQLHVSSSPVSNAIRLQSQPLLAISHHLELINLPLSAAKYRPIYRTFDIITIRDFGRTPLRVWGRSGDRPGSLCRPWGIAINRFNEIFVADRSNNRIQVFDTEGSYIRHFGSHGSGPRQFNKPTAVTINANEDIVVVDKDNHRVQVFTRHGEFLLTFGKRGSEIGEFLYPWDVTTDSLGHILVSDSRNHRIQLFKWNGIFVTLWGNNSPSIGRIFDSPRGVTFDPNGNILVTDFNLHRVVVIERLTGRIRFIGRDGSERGQFNRPQGICCDDRGWFVVADSRNYRYQVFNERGEFMWMVGVKGKKEPGEMDRPSDMCIDLEGHIILMDFGNERVQMF